MAKLPPKGVIKLGSVEVTTGVDSINRLALLLWGPSAVGKSTFAATAPGEKLWLSMGDGEHKSVISRKDVHVADLSRLSLDEFFNQAKGKDPFGLDKFLAEHQSIATVVVDSATSLAYNCLLRAIDQGVGGGPKFTPSVMTPGISAYGGRNGLVLEILTGLMRVTAKHGVHIIMTAHEADPDMKIVDGRELIDKISIMLGGQIVNNMGLRLSEIWYLGQRDLGKEVKRYICMRPTQMRRPMKSRMFTDLGPPEFAMPYNANKPDKGQMTIASLHDAWMANNGAKIPVPGSKV